jgi:predicted esterase YcpF (UPF0227 family)
MAKKEIIENARTLRCYVQICLADSCAEYSSIIEEIQENRIHPSRNKNPKERITFLQKLADEKLDYIRQVIIDLKKLK